MKLREYGAIIHYLSNHDGIDSSVVGEFAWHFKNLVEDWTYNNNPNEGNNSDWLLERPITPQKKKIEELK